jgi:hypothetical protein
LESRRRKNDLRFWAKVVSSPRRRFRPAAKDVPNEKVLARNKEILVQSENFLAFTDAVLVKSAKMAERRSKILSLW